MTPRIFGLETEYGIIVARRPGASPTSAREGGELPTVEQAVKLMFEATPNAFRTTNHFLPNGGRLYVDIGSHPEYASAECVRLDDLVANDQAGDRFVQDLADTANAVLAERGVPAGIHVLRNNADSFGQTFGCHENYSASRSSDFGHLIRTLTALLVTRPILTGCGDLIAEADGSTRFVVSTRSEHIATTSSADPTKERPLVNTKDEPHADRTRWRRLHVISGDSSMAETTTALKAGWTALVLDLAEHGGSLDDLLPEDPMAAMRIVNRDITGRARFTTVEGRQLSALDVQREILSRVLDRGIAEDHQARWVVDLVTRSLDALASGNLDRIGTELDWVVTWRLLQRQRERTGVDWGHASLARLVLAIRDLSPTAGLAGRLRASGQMAAYCTAEQLQDALTNPPTTTRARVRGKFVGWAAERGYRASVDWSHVRLDGPIRPQIDLLDPFASRSGDVAALLAELS
ncbi:MAG: proteasome accessory factor PafA2 family protein [Microlunatus sp.]|nr:proteasome accessory factor PafA2 family protein [Microlunatus sp.]MDN5769293.1 proteasome accessory factor PafA2 family protein [Microlunatus sp.]